jgi:hypothetical protein
MYFCFHFLTTWFQNRRYSDSAQIEGYLSVLLICQNPCPRLHSVINYKTKIRRTEATLLWCQLDPMFSLRIILMISRLPLAGLRQFIEGNGWQLTLTNMINLDFRLPPRCWWNLRSSGGITRRCAVIVYRRFGTTNRSHPHGSRVRVGKKANL